MKINQITEEGFNITLSENEVKLIALIIGSMTTYKVKEIQGTLWFPDVLGDVEYDSETLANLFYPFLSGLRRE